MRILVLLGGSSPEREVSLDSGRAVAAALRERGHDVGEIDPAVTSVCSIERFQWDIALPMVHGVGGEDGTLQTDLQRIGLRWVGSSPEASELTFDKIRTANFLRRHGVRVPDHVVVHRDTSDEQIRELVAERFQHPIVVKPPRQGSSVGVSLVSSAAELPDALRLAFEYDDECLVQPFIDGREITIPVVDGQALPAIEIRPAADWYDYEAKYQDDRTEYIVRPGNLPSDLNAMAVRACEICEVGGIARVDFIVDAYGGGWLLEINTIPGMTSHSLVPKSALAVGQSLGALCEQAALHRLRTDD